MIIFYAVSIIVLLGIVSVALSQRNKSHSQFRAAWRDFAGLHGLSFIDAPKPDWPRIEGLYGGVPVSMSIRTSGVRVRTFEPLYEGKFAAPLPDGMRIEDPRRSFGRPTWSVKTGDPDLDKAVVLGVKSPGDAAMLNENRDLRDAVIAFFRDSGKASCAVNSAAASILGLPLEKDPLTLLARLESVRTFVRAVDQRTTVR